MEHLKLVNTKRVCEFKIILTSTSIFLLNLTMILVLGLFDSSIDDGQFFVLNIVFLFKICFETMTNFFIVTIQIQHVRPEIRNRENHQGYRGRLLKKLEKNQVKNEERLMETCRQLPPGTFLSHLVAIVQTASYIARISSEYLQNTSPLEKPWFSFWKWYVLQKHLSQ